jgi:hypothetical protein
LAKSRPPAQNLTEFYLWISLGGVLGGIFNALLAPQIFDHLVEYPLVIVLACLLVPEFRARGRPSLASTGVARLSAVASSMFWVMFGLGCGCIFYELSFGDDRHSIHFMERNFFGVVRVRVNQNYREMIHGTTSHGMQCRIPGREREPLTYFTRVSPIGQVFNAFSGSKAKQKVAVIGLGAGTLACYAERGQQWTFYEIDPAVERIARDPRYFTFLADAERCGAKVQVVLGDGRLQLGKASVQYDMLVLDAFSSDSVPVHLLTREGVDLYLRKLAPTGILAFHLTNNYLRLASVVAALADDLGLACLVQRDFDISQIEFAAGRYPSQWVVLARRPEDLGPLRWDSRWRKPAGDARHQVWTDDYSNLLSVFIWDQEEEYRREVGGSR